MSLINLQSSDSGQYECRANSDIGSAKSVSVQINVKGLLCDFECAQMNHDDKCKYYSGFRRYLPLVNGKNWDI